MALLSVLVLALCDVGGERELLPGESSVVVEEDEGKTVGGLLPKSGRSRR